MVYSIHMKKVFVCFLLLVLAENSFILAQGFYCGKIPPATVKPACTAFVGETFPMADAVFTRLAATARTNAIARFSSPSRANQAYISGKPPFLVHKFFSEEVSSLARSPMVSSSMEGQLFDLLCQLEKDSRFPADITTDLKKALTTRSLAARLRWPEIWAEISLDYTRWPFQAADFTPPQNTDSLHNLIVLVINDDPEIVAQIRAQLMPYTSHILVAYDLSELERHVQGLKYRNQRPHYVITDGAIGRYETDADAKQLIKQSFPEIADAIGFVLLSDSSSLLQASRRGYVSDWERIGNDSFPNMGYLLLNLENKLHIGATINSSPIL